MRSRFVVRFAVKASVLVILLPCMKGHTWMTNLLTVLSVESGFFAAVTSTSICVHTPEKSRSHVQCGKSFVCRCDHKIHIRMHSGEKQFACTECGKSFLRSTELKIHMRLHTGEKPYSCQDCGKRFIRSNQLKRHKKTHMIVKPF